MIYFFHDIKIKTKEKLRENKIAAFMSKLAAVCGSKVAAGVAVSKKS